MRDCFIARDSLLCGGHGGLDGVEWEASASDGAGGWQTVKTWGPIRVEALENAWHHIALTLRFAPISSVTELPDAMLAQAFFFIDGQSVKDDGTFLLLVS